MTHSISIRLLLAALLLINSAEAVRAKDASPASTSLPTQATASPIAGPAEHPAPPAQFKSLASSFSPAGSQTSATPSGGGGLGEFYFSWGYNSNRYAPTDIHFSQPSLGNEFTFHAVSAHDNEGWTSHLLEHDLTVPQFSVRLGYFFNAGQDLAIELAYDHPKFIVDQGQRARLTGTVDGASRDDVLVLTPDVLRYWLNNGANFVTISLVKRLPLAKAPGRLGSLAFLGKVGSGFMYPHTDNTVLGVKNRPGFQTSGWNLAADATIRFGLPWSFYLEATEKVVYARYSGVRIHEGTAHHSLRDNEVILTIGRAFNKRRP